MQVDADVTDISPYKKCDCKNGRTQKRTIGWHMRQVRNATLADLLKRISRASVSGHCIGIFSCSSSHGRGYEASVRHQPSPHESTKLRSRCTKCSRFGHNSATSPSGASYSRLGAKPGEKMTDVKQQRIYRSHKANTTTNHRETAGKIG